MRITSLVPLLNVADLGQSLAFYRGLLGFEVLNQAADEAGRPVWALIGRDGARLMLNVNGRISAADRTARGSYEDTVLFFEVDDAAGIHSALIVHGAEVGPLTRQDYGMDDFVVRDPDGYELSFGSPVPAHEQVRPPV